MSDHARRLRRLEAAAHAASCPARTAAAQLAFLARYGAGDDVDLDRAWRELGAEFGTDAAGPAVVRGYLAED